MGRGRLTWSHLVLFDFIGTRLDSLGPTWTHFDSLGLAWIHCTHLDTLGLTWTHLHSLGLTWSHLDSLGLTWTHLDSLGSTWIHLDSLGPTRSHEGQERGSRAKEKREGVVCNPEFDLIPTRHADRAHIRTHPCMARDAMIARLNSPIQPPIKMSQVE